MMPVKFLNTKYLFCFVLFTLVNAVFADPAQGETFYREVFVRIPEATGKDAAQSSGWKALRSRQPEGKPSYLKVFPPGSPTILPAVNSSPAGNEEGHALWSRTESGALIIYTDEISFDISELFSVRYEQRLNGIAASTHLALLIGSTWYISDAPALQKQRGIWENVEYSLAGMTFGTAVHTPCLGPPLPENSGFHLPPIGQVLAFGVVVKDVNGRIRIDNFALNNRHPEGAQYVQAVLQV